MRDESSPENASDPTEVGEAEVLARLAELDVEYELIPIDPTLADTASFCEHYDQPIENAANTLLVTSRRTPPVDALCVVLATSRLDVNRKVRALVGAGKLSFASVERMRERTGMRVGGVTPFGVPDDLPVLVDERVLSRPWVIVGTGGRESKLRISPHALLRLPSARAADLARDA